MMPVSVKLKYRRLEDTLVVEYLDGECRVQDFTEEEAARFLSVYPFLMRHLFLAKLTTEGIC